MRRTITATALALAALSGCGPAGKETDTKNVFGSDDRTQMTTATGPYRAIGMVRSGSSFCTGSLVWHNLVLTNAHCVYDNGQPRQNIKFIAGEGTNNEQTVNVSNFWAGTSNPQSNRSQDWAILRLQTSLSRYYFGYKSQQNLNPFTHPLTMVGYSGDFYQQTGRAGIHAGCRIRGDQNNYYLHDCDTRGGSSGGPIFALVDGHHFIVAINAAHRFCNGSECPSGIPYSNANANIAVKTNAFTQRLTQLREAFPAP